MNGDTISKPGLQGDPRMKGFLSRTSVVELAAWFDDVATHENRSTGNQVDPSLECGDQSTLSAHQTPVG
jgi:hypothetical protein